MEQEHFSKNGVDGIQAFLGQHGEMKREEKDFWKRFEKSGAILDYLSYTACTSESRELLKA